MAAEFSDLRRQVEVAIERLDESGEGEGEVVEEVVIAPEVALTIGEGLRASLLLADASMGECQRAVPFSPMRPVLREGSEEIRWCCNHNPQHCGS